MAEYVQGELAGHGSEGTGVGLHLANHGQGCEVVTVDPDDAAGVGPVRAPVAEGNE